MKPNKNSILLRKERLNIMKQFLLEQWICNNCDFEFFTKGYPEDMICCPNCQESDDTDNGRTFKAEEWRGEELE